MPDILDQIAGGTYQPAPAGASPPKPAAPDVLDQIATGTYQRAATSAAVPAGGWDAELRALARSHGLTVTSAQRSKARQARVNPGSPNSYHTSPDWNSAGALDIAGDH